MDLVDADGESAAVKAGIKGHEGILLLLLARSGTRGTWEHLPLGTGKALEEEEGGDDRFSDAGDSDTFYDAEDWLEENTGW